MHAITRGNPSKHVFLYLCLIQRVDVAHAACLPWYMMRSQRLLRLCEIMFVSLLLCFALIRLVRAQALFELVVRRRAAESALPVIELLTLVMSCHPIG